MSNLRAMFGTRLRTLRRDASMTQEELANAAGISIDFISLIERGINAPSFENLEKISKALNVEIWKLFIFNGNDK